MTPLDADESASTVDAHGIKPPPAFSIEEEPAGDGVVMLVLTGEIDLATSGEFRRYAARAVDDGARALVLDVAEVSFIDSTMLKELLRAHSDLQPGGGRVVLAGVRGAVLRLLELTRTAELFELAPTRAEALERATR